MTLGKKALTIDECITCFEKNGLDAPFFDTNEQKCISCEDADPSKPAFKDGFCVTCEEADPAKPYYDDNQKTYLSCVEVNEEMPEWNGTECSCAAGSWAEDIVCAEGTTWNGTECEQDGVVITTATGSFKLSKDMIFMPKSYNSEQEYGVIYCLPAFDCLKMASDDKYPELTACSYDTKDGGDCWAAGVKHCRDQGKRLPTAAELEAVAQKLYGGTNSIVDNTLKEILWTTSEPDAAKVTFKTNLQYDGANAYHRKFSLNSTYSDQGRRAGVYDYMFRYFCVPE